MQVESKGQNFFEISKITKILIIITASLILIHLVLQFVYHVLGIELVSTLRGRFDVDNEISIPTWFSQILLLLPAGLAYLIYRTTKKPDTAWLLLSGLFVFFVYR